MNIFKYLFSWKYRYFVQKRWGVQKMIADYEFKRHKTLEIREEIRQQYDQERARLPILEEQIKNQKENPTLEAGEIARLDDQKVLLEKTIARFLEQIKGLDIEVDGAKPSPEHPEGAQGLNHVLDSLRELTEMLRIYTNKI